MILHALNRYELPCLDALGFEHFAERSFPLLGDKSVLCLAATMHAGKIACEPFPSIHDLDEQLQQR